MMPVVWRLLQVLLQVAYASSSRTAQMVIGNSGLEIDEGRQTGELVAAAR